MYRSYSPGESSSVAVVPSPHSLSPLCNARSPPFAFESEFGCDLSPAKKRICLDQITGSSDFSFAQFSLPILPEPSSASPDRSSSSFSPPPTYNFGGSAAAPADYQFGSFDSVFQQDSKAGLASYLQQDARAAIQQTQQQQQQQAQMHSLAAGQAQLPAAGARKEDYSMVMYQEPEEYYRARYETEGIRGPLKGRENNHPAVRVIGPRTYAGTVRVMLVHDDGTKHTSCFLDETKDRQKALAKKIDPQSNMIVEFEDLRIRRETKQKNYSKEGGGRKADKAKSARNDKTACLRFTATLQLAPDHEIELIIMSKPIQLCAPPEGAELEWLIPEYGHANGDERVVIKGTKMTCPKVTFTIVLPEGQIELPGHVDKEQSHQNVLVVKTPRLPEELRNYQGCFKADVRVSSGRAGTCSAPLPFYYIPNGVCHTCKQTLPQVSPTMAAQQTPSFIPPYFPLSQCSLQSAAISSISLAAAAASCSTTPSLHAPLPSFQEIQQPQVSYMPRPQCGEQIPSVTLSHPPPPASVSTPPPPPPSSPHKDSLQQLFENHATANVGVSQSPSNLSPTSSPGGVVTSEAGYWPGLPPTLTSASVAMNQPDISGMIHGEFQPITTANTASLVTSPGSYSTVPSPDTTTPIYPPFTYTLDDSHTPYRQFTS